jgi:hypoxanthine phosphoribosyltransferase
MRGALYFAADLTRALNCSVEVQPVRSVSYSAQEVGVQLPYIQFELFELNPAGRDILLIDDICDSGRTIDTLSKQLLDQGARSVRSAVLIHRISPNNLPFSPTWECFRYNGPEWFVGYGMEELDRFRNLPAVHMIVDETLHE